MKNKKVLILYSSRHGTTEKVATYIQHRLEADVQLVRLDNPNENPRLDDWENIIIGGSIHIGQIQKEVSQFCEKFESDLLKKNLGLYLCCMIDEKAEEQFRNVYPESLRNHAAAKSVMGGEILLEKMNFLDKMITKYIAKTKASVSKLNYPAIDDFIEKYQAKLKTHSN